MNNFLEFHERSNVTNRPYYRGTWEPKPSEKFRLPPFQFALPTGVKAYDYDIYHIQDGVETNVTSYFNGITAPPNPPVVRNVEYDYSLTPSEETVMTVTAIDTGNSRLTFSALPEDFDKIMDNAETDKEWICINIDSWSGADYTEVVQVDSQNDTLEFNVSTITGFGTLSTWSVGDQVAFWNPFTFNDFGDSNDSDLEEQDYNALESASSAYLAAGPFWKKSDNTWMSIHTFVNLDSTTVQKPVLATAQSPMTGWTADTSSFAYAASDFGSSDYLDRSVPGGNPIWIEDEQKFLITVSVVDSAASNKFHISMLKFDENFENLEYSDRVVEETGSYGCMGSSVIEKDGTYYLFYTHRVDTLSDPAGHWDFCMQKSTSLTSGYGDKKTLQAGSTSGSGPDADIANQWYNGWIDGSCPFEYGGNIYVYISGTSRDETSVTGRNREIGIARFNTTTEELEFLPTGLVLVNPLTGAWTGTSWAKDHTGSGATIVKDGQKYYSNTSMNNSSDSYEVKFFDTNIPRTINRGDFFIYNGNILNNMLPEGSCYFRIESNRGEIYESDVIEIGGVNNWLTSWTATVGTPTISGTDITSMSTSDVCKSNTFDIVGGDVVNLVFERATGTIEPVVRLYDSSDVLQGTLTRYDIGDLRHYTITTTRSYRDAYLTITAGSSYTASDFEIFKDYSNEFIKIKVTSDVDYGGVKYADEWGQWLFKKATVQRSPRVEFTQVGDEVNGKLIVEKSTSAVRYVVRMKVTESEFEALVHAVNGTLEVTDQTGKVFNAENVELSDPTWYQSNGIAELTFIDSNNINVHTLNNSEL